MEDVIVRETIHGEMADGTPFDIVIEIGAPAPYEQSANEWTCLLRAPALHYPNAPIHGGSALQALCLALRLARAALTDVRESGGKLGYEPGQDNYDIGVNFGVHDPTGQP